MKIHRFIGAFDLNQAELVLDAPDVVHQITTVLRMLPGQQILLCDGNGREAYAQILNLDKRHVHVQLDRVDLLNHESTCRVILYCAILKRENFELIVQKTTEVGIAEIFPLLTKRTVKQQIKMDRLLATAKEAAEQSGRGIVPLIHEPTTWHRALEQARLNDRNYFYHTQSINNEERKVKSETQSLNFKQIGIWIGPEGGWDETEVQEIADLGWPVKSLGPFTLRAETAAIISSYLAVRSFTF